MFQIRSGLDGTLDSFSGGGLRPDDSDDGWGSVGDPDLADRTIVSRAGGQDGICLSRDPFEWSCYFPECAGRPFQAEPCILQAPVRKRRTRDDVTRLGPVVVLSPVPWS